MTADEAYREWAEELFGNSGDDGPSEDDWYTFTAGFQAGRREGYAEALKDAVLQIHDRMTVTGGSRSRSDLVTEGLENALEAVRALESEKK